MSRLVGSLAAYRATGADLPFGRPERAHGVAMEGYFWRIEAALPYLRTDPGRQDPGTGARGTPWGRMVP